MMEVHEIVIRRCPSTGVWSSELLGHESNKLKKRKDIKQADSFSHLQTQLSESIELVNNNFKK